MKLVVMIPAFNEEGTIGSVIREIPREIEGVDSVEVLVIDDGSTDRTAEAGREAGADAIISHNKNKGVGMAFSTGIEEALDLGADVIVNIDADGQFDPKDIPTLIEPIVKGEADFVTASRFLDKDLKPNMPLIKKVGNNIFTGLINWLTGERFTDTQCGFRGLSKHAAMKLNLFGEFTYTQEVFLDLVNKDLTIREIPLRVKYSADRASKVVKNPISYGIKVLVILIRTMRDFKPLVFFGTMGLLVFLSGFASGSWLFTRWLLTHKVSPYRSLVDLSAVFLVMGFLLIVLALIADMLGRQRRIQEELLYYHKLSVYGNKKREGRK